jgi:hypothetical protein
MKVVIHALHLTTVVTNADVTLLKDVKPNVELQNGDEFGEPFPIGKFSAAILSGMMLSSRL